MVATKDKPKQEYTTDYRAGYKAGSSGAAYKARSGVLNISTEAIMREDAYRRGYRAGRRAKQAEEGGFWVW